VRRFRWGGMVRPGLRGGKGTGEFERRGEKTGGKGTAFPGEKTEKLHLHELDSDKSMQKPSDEATQNRSRFGRRNDGREGGAWGGALVQG